MTMSATTTSAPFIATDAVLKPSVPLPADSKKVHGVEFNEFKDRDGGITAEELVRGMAGMGFQASAVADAVKIIEDMVCGIATFAVKSHHELLSRYHPAACSLDLPAIVLNISTSVPGKIPRHLKGLPSS